MNVSASIQERQERLRRIHAARLASKPAANDEDPLCDTVMRSDTEATSEKKPAAKANRQQRKKRAAARMMGGARNPEEDTQEKLEPNASDSVRGPSAGVTNELMQCADDLGADDTAGHQPRADVSTTLDVDEPGDTADAKTRGEGQREPMQVAAELDARGPDATPGAHGLDQDSVDLLIQQLLASQAPRPRISPKNKTQERLQKQLRQREETKLREMFDGTTQTSGEKQKPMAKKLDTKRKVQKHQEFTAAVQPAGPSAGCALQLGVDGGA
jgi:hypothetical protein